MHKIVSSILMIALILLTVLQIQAANRSENQCWQQYVYTIGHFAGPQDGADQRLDEAWQTYTACSRRAGINGLWAHAQ